MIWENIMQFLAHLNGLFPFTLRATLFLDHFAKNINIRTPQQQSHVLKLGPNEIIPAGNVPNV